MTIDTASDWATLVAVIVAAGCIGALIATVAAEGRQDRAKGLHAHLARIERRMIDLEVQGLARPEPTTVLPQFVEDRGWLPPAPISRVERRQLTTELAVVTSVPVPMRHRPTFRAALAQGGVA